MSTAPEPRSRAVLPTKSFVALVAAVATLLVIGVLSYRMVPQRAQAAAMLTRTNEVTRQLSRFRLDLKDAESAQRGFLLAGTERYLAPFEVARTSAAEGLAKVREREGDDRRSPEVPRHGRERLHRQAARPRQAAIRRARVDSQVTDSASSLPTVHELELGLLLDAIYRCYHLLQGVSRGLVEREDKLQSPPTLAAHLVRAVTPHSRMEHLR